MEHSVYIKKRFNHPIEKVWKFITASELVSKWFMNVEKLELVENGEYHLTGQPTEKWDGNIVGKVLEVSEEKKFVHTFKTNSMEDFTEVTWILEEAEDNGTLLTLIHKGNDNIKDLVGFIESVDSGWMNHLTTFSKLINGQTNEVC